MRDIHQITRIHKFLRKAVTEDVDDDNDDDDDDCVLYCSVSNFTVFVTRQHDESRLIYLKLRLAFPLIST